MILDEIKDTLPDKASELLRLAIHDLELCEKDPRYQIFMSDWHYATDYRKECHVCFAGSVMAQSCKIPSNITVTPYRSTGLSGKLLALNHFRIGNVVEALDLLNNPCDPFHDCDSLTIGERPAEYILDRDLFKQQMLDLADILEVEGY